MLDRVGSSTSGWCALALHNNTNDDSNDNNGSINVLACVLLVVNCFVHCSLAIAAVVLSTMIRNVPSQFNETRHIAKATYNLLTFGSAMVLVGLLTNDNLLFMLAITLAILLCVLSFVAFVYVPKVSAVLRHSNQANVKSSEVKSKTRGFLFAPRVPNATTMLSRRDASGILM
eukprot:c12942_g1_i2.p1 GENE.c12942_g1_i2~~c12942_g1_i2.p1  ORF type:complete len:173 (-),score=60.44 c12942_g1_i2:30-548(-)